nr:TauD/TfdA family dioxygenase [Pseudomonas quercus]
MATYTGCGSRAELDLHIENASQIYDTCGDTSPLALLLNGVRRDPNGLGPKTWIADSRKALKSLNEEDIEILYGKNFIIRKPYRWRANAAQPKENLLHSILSGPILYPRVTAAFYPNMVTPVGKDAMISYEKFYKALKQISVPIDIAPGILVFINNRFTLHSRDSFTPSYDENGGAYRWIQRLFITNNLWNFRAYAKCGARIFQPAKY